MSNISGEAAADERYLVISALDFAHVSTPFLTATWIILATVARIAFHSPWGCLGAPSSLVPESCLLLLLGLLSGLLLHLVDHTSFRLDAHTFFYYLLPPIVLDAGYFMPARAFFDNIGTIGLFAIPGTLFNALAIGTTLYALSELGIFGNNFEQDLLGCLLFGSVISAVDPVAVLSVLQEVQVHDVLNELVVGESILNDAVTVVLYHMFEAYYNMGVSNINKMDVMAGIAQFFITSIGGVLLGVAWGLVTAFLTRFTKHVRVVEPVLVLLMAYLAYLSADTLHLSGIMSIVSCGMSMKHYVEENISHKSHTTIKYVMKMMSSSSESIIFLLLGLSTVMDSHDCNTVFVISTILLCLTYRIVSVLVLCKLANYFRVAKIKRVEQVIIAYGGLRGALSFALAVLLKTKHLQIFVTTTIAEIYFTVLLQGATIRPLVKCLHVQTQSPKHPTLIQLLHERLTDHMMAGIEDISGNLGQNHWRDKWEHLDNRWIKPIFIQNYKRHPHENVIIHRYTALNIRDTMNNLALTEINDKDGKKNKESRDSKASFHQMDGATAKTHYLLVDNMRMPRKAQRPKNLMSKHNVNGDEENRNFLHRHKRLGIKHLPSQDHHQLNTIVDDVLDPQLPSTSHNTKS